MADTSEFETVNYRLEKIENSIEELRKVLIESRIQAHDITDIKSDIVRLDDKIDKIESKVQEIDLKPTKDKEVAGYFQCLRNKRIMHGCIDAYGTFRNS